MAVSRAMLAAALLAALTALAIGRQKPERHYGCPPGKNACVYPIDAATLQCETIFDFQVALHISENATVRRDWRNEIDVQIKLPNSTSVLPEALFGKKPQMRMWKIQAFEDSADETPEGFDSYAITWRNVFFPQAVGKGPVVITVKARNVITQVKYEIREPKKRRAKNVVLLIGDGMSLPMMAAARLVSRGMYQGKFNDLLYMEKFPNFGLQNPSGVDSIITDSANSASSLNTGQKSSVNALGVYADSSNENFTHPKVETIAEHIRRKFNMGVGVVTTAEIQDATPAAVWAHTRRRDKKAAITSQAINGCKDCTGVVMPDVLMGGGGQFFLPAASIDGSDMYKNYSAKGYTVTHTRAEMLAAAKNPATKKLLTITHFGDMDVWLDRNVYKQNTNVSLNDPRGKEIAPTSQPNLDEMVMSAIDILSKNPNGFFLQVEAASIDKSAHPLDVPRLISDLIELDNTVGKVDDWAKKNGDDTLIIATADHGHGFDVFGTVDTKIWDDAVKASDTTPVSDFDNYCGTVTDNSGKTFFAKKEPMFNQVLRDSNRARRKAIGTYQNAGYPDYEDRNKDNFPDTWDVRTVLAAGMNNFPDHTVDYKVSTKLKVPAVPLADLTWVNNPEDQPNGIFISGNLSPTERTGVHTMQDVGIFATGPGSDAVKGIIDNTEIFHVIAGALGFGTNGEMASMDAVEAQCAAVKMCMNDGKMCHCDRVGGVYQCACMPGGPTTYVDVGMKKCPIDNGRTLPPRM